MSNYVHEIIFFHNAQSPLCGHVHKLLKSNNIPALYFNVNSKEVANKLKNGQHFQVTHVPTLVVSFKDGNLKKFEGQECFQWLQYASQNDKKRKHEPSKKEESFSSSSDDEDELLYSEEDDEGGDDAEILEDLDQKSYIPKQRVIADNDKVDVSAVAQLADQERSQLEETMNPKLRRRTKH